MLAFILIACFVTIIAGALFEALFGSWMNPCEYPGAQETTDLEDELMFKEEYESIPPPFGEEICCLQKDFNI